MVAVRCNSDTNTLEYRLVINILAITYYYGVIWFMKCNLNGNGTDLYSSAHHVLRKLFSG
jgi:hypothetical protein